MANNSMYLRRKNKLIVEPYKGSAEKVSIEHLATFLKNISALGYTMSNELLERLSLLPLEGLVRVYADTVEDLKLMVGAHVKYKPMYKNFPTQVMEMSDAELYFNAMWHYFGDWVGLRILPHYETLKREPLEDDVKLKVIGLGTEEDFQSIFANLVGAGTSLSETDKGDVAWFVHNFSDNDELFKMLPDSIPMKENIALMFRLINTYGLDTEGFLKKYAKTATDILRVAVATSDGDISLAQPSKFRNFRRRERRMFLSVLDGIKYITEDMLRYAERWKRLGEKLHPYDYIKSYPNACASFKILWDKEKFETFNSKVEKAIHHFEIDTAVKLLSTRPGEYARRLDNLIRLSDNPKGVVSTFNDVADKVSTPVLLQVKAHFANRHEKSDIRTFFPKGNVSRIQARENTLQRINPSHCKKIVKACEMALVERFSAGDSLGKVWIDEKLEGYHVPFSQRSASKTLRSVARGSRYDLPDGNTARFFIWWKDGMERTDLDLSAIFFDEKYEQVKEISYTNLRSTKFGVVHSGDITSAPNGASEFIDVPIEKCLEAGARYVMMSVFSYTQQPFHDLPDCFAGVMARQKPKSGEIYDPKTVDNKMDLTVDTSICIPLIIDLKERQVIWVDLGLKSNSSWYNNLHGNKSSLQLIIRSMVQLKKPNLHDLFRMHAKARGEIVDNAFEADTIFSVDSGITPFDTDIIISEYI